MHYGTLSRYPRCSFIKKIESEPKLPELYGNKRPILSEHKEKLAISSSIYYINTWWARIVF